MHDRSLHDLVVSYRTNGKGQEEILERIAALVYKAYERFGFDDEDDAADALIKYKSRIIKLIERFEDRGLRFDSYLATSLRYLARTVRRDRKKAADRELVCEHAVNSCSGVGSSIDIDALFEISEGGKDLPSASENSALRPMPRRRPRARGGLLRYGASEEAAYSSRLVYLAIKCAWEIDEAGIARAADSSGVDRQWLAAAIEQARRSMEAERARIERLTQRRNASWCRLRMLESRIAVELDESRRSRLAAAIERERIRSARVAQELGCLRTVVPNSIVARILGVPKGTVDSGLFYLRKRFGPQE